MDPGSDNDEAVLGAICGFEGIVKVAQVGFLSRPDERHCAARTDVISFMTTSHESWAHARGFLTRSFSSIVINIPCL